KGSFLACLAIAGNNRVMLMLSGLVDSVCRDIPLPHATGARDERLRRPEAEGGVLGEVQEERRAGGQQEARLRDRRRDRGGVQDLHGAQQQGRAAQLQPRHVHQVLPSMVSENKNLAPSRHHLFFNFSAVFSSVQFSSFQPEQTCLVLCMYFSWNCSCHVMSSSLAHRLLLPSTC
uniref:Uncharacterized protein n=1 Tax=Aegilops tauschii subsp. strangulata TaxID=200361 RepID=A0A453LVX3_AEGTS